MSALRVFVLMAIVTVTLAFAPTQRSVPQSQQRLGGLNMGIDEYIGNAVEIGGFWDPLGLAAKADDETLKWYRAAELKHGRVCMLATLGVVVTGLGYHLPNPAFQEADAFKALSSIAETSPWALVQVAIGISAVEVLGASVQSQTERAGDLSWDPLNIRPKDPEVLDELQLKELKNGRLAMLSFTGMVYQNYLTGQGTIEQLTSGHVSPFGDGQGLF
jgi:light-harvesting complex I chlorophyll a/b binding protein 1